MKYTIKQKLDILKLHKNGSTATSISEKIPCPRSYVYYILNERERIESMPAHYFYPDFTQLKDILYEALEMAMEPFQQGDNGNDVLKENVSMTQNMDVRFRKADNVVAIQNMKLNVDSSRKIIQALRIVEDYTKGNTKLIDLMDDI